MKLYYNIKLFNFLEKIEKTTYLSTEISPEKKFNFFENKRDFKRLCGYFLESSQK